MSEMQAKQVVVLRWARTVRSVHQSIAWPLLLCHVFSPRESILAMTACL